MDRDARILICGARDWADPGPIYETLKGLKEKYGPITIIHGAAPGADTMAGVMAREMGLQVLAFPAHWNLFGKAAGPIRNQQMLVEGKPNLVVAFFKNRAKSKGTANMVLQTERAGVPLMIYEKDIGWTRDDLKLLSLKKGR